MIYIFVIAFLFRWRKLLIFIILKYKHLTDVHAMQEN